MGLALAASIAADGGDTAWAQGLEEALVAIPGGTFIMGDPQGEADEAPRTASVEPFRLMRLEVTNRLFADYVAATAYRTDGEKTGGGFVWRGTWRRVAGADWRHPHGPQSDIDGMADHPVVQVSADDAAAFCAWHGLRLPTETEWEFAARGTEARRFPWGDEPPHAGRRRQANFGTLECCGEDATDGYARSAPGGSFPTGASPFALLDMAGNVWEWTKSAFPGRPGLVVLRGGGWGNNLHCLRTSYRHGNPPDIGLNMVGLRCAGDAP